MEKQSRRFIISLTIVLLISYGIIMSAIGIHSFLKVQKLKQQIFSLTLARQELERQAETISSQLQDYERGRAILEQSLEKLNRESKQKLDQSSLEIKNYKKQVNELTKGLEESQKKLIMLEEENKLLRQTPLLDTAEQQELQLTLLQKEDEIVKLKQKMGNLEQELRDKKATIHYNLAVNFSQMNDFENAIIEYEKSLSIDPDHFPSHYNLGILYEEYKKDYPQAISHYRRCLELSPDSEEAEQVHQWILDLEAKQVSSSKQ
jgi:tetratricopeptide (TPR) repeat protein